MSVPPPIELSVKRYLPRVKDFERDAAGNLVWDSLQGPERIEGRQQIARERLIAGAEMKILHAQLRWCYHKEGVNHLENCKPLVDEILKKSHAPYWGMPNAPQER